MDLGNELHRFPQKSKLGDVVAGIFMGLMGAAFAVGGVANEHATVGGALFMALLGLLFAAGGMWMMRDGVRDMRTKPYWALHERGLVRWSETQHAPPEYVAFADVAEYIRVTHTRNHALQGYALQLKLKSEKAAYVDGREFKGIDQTVQSLVASLIAQASE